MTNVERLDGPWQVVLSHATEVAPRQQRTTR
ncbi:MAG: hypothetical protein ACI8TP_004677 [Acidimicrobiales bacterium]|jgi:hypothetical protein